MCTVLLPPGVNPIGVNKYIISYQNKWQSFITDVSLEDKLKNLQKVIDPDYEKLITDK
jgi:hypothetical protein